MSESPSVGFTITSDPDTTSVGTAPSRSSERERGGAFRLFLVSDLDPQGAVQDWSEGERAWDVDKNTFADRMREHGPRLEVGGEDRPALAWTADALEAFTPEGIAQRVPTLASVAQAHAALGDAASGKIDLEALRARLQDSGVAQADALADAVVARTSSQKAPDDDGSLDTLLGMVSLGNDNAPPENPTVGALVEAASSDAPQIDRAAARRLADDLEGRLRGTLSALVAHDDVRRAEAAWRGLKLLVDRLDFRSGARLSVLAAPKDALAAAVHFQVLLPEYEHGAERAPLAAILLDHDAVATSNDLNTLGDLAASGASLQVPVVVSAGPAFFGLEAETDFSRLPPTTALLQQQQYARFQSIRKRPEAAQLVLAVPPFLLRHGYGPDHPDKAFGLEGERLWGGAALLVGLAMAEAHKQRGWPVAAAGQAVPDLEVRQTRMGAMPLAASFSDSVLDDLARAGILGFAGPLRKDHAVMGPPASTAVPADASGEARARATLSAAVASALASHRALTVGPECAGLEVEPAIAEIERRFRSFLGGTNEEDAVTVQHLEEHDSETSRTYGVRLRPPRAVLPHPVGIVFGVDVPMEPAHAG